MTDCMNALYEWDCLPDFGAGRSEAAWDAIELRRFLAGEPIHARPVGRFERLWRWCKRQPVVAGLTGAVAVTLFLGAVTSSYFAITATAQRNRADVNTARANQKANEAEANAKRADEKTKEVSDEKSRTEAQLQRARIAQYTTQINLASAT